MNQIDDPLIQDNNDRLPNVKVPEKTYGSKFQSKREIYVFLAQENNVYLPPYGKYPLVQLTHPRLVQTT